MEGLGETCGGSKAEVGAIDVGQAIGDEDGGQKNKPALAHLRLHFGRAAQRIIGRTLESRLHGVMIICAARGFTRCWPCFTKMN